MGYRRRKMDFKPKNSSFLLNITSMTDMFTIMLVFLLQTYASSDIQIQPEKNLNLPTSKIDKNPLPAIQIYLSSDALKLDGHVLAQLDKGEFKGSDTDANDPQFIQSLFDVLRKKAVNDPKEEKEGKVFLLADSSLPYTTLKKVMYTASMAGFPSLKLATNLGN